MSELCSIELDEVDIFAEVLSKRTESSQGRETTRTGSSLKIVKTLMR
jgi:hypothetical protein